MAASLDEAIARARADLVAAVGPGIDLTSPCCLSRSRRVDRLVVRYMRLRS